jgi:hypothetical protein
MFTKRITAALFAIAIASSLIVASGFVGSAFAAKNRSTNPTNTIINSYGEDKSSSLKSQTANVGGSIGATGDSNGISAKDLKSLSKCQSGAAADGDLTLAEVKDCYGQAFDQGHGQGKYQSSSVRGNDLSNQGKEALQQESISLHGQKIGTMREGFPF